MAAGAGVAALTGRRRPGGLPPRHQCCTTMRRLTLKGGVYV